MPPDRPPNPHLPPEPEPEAGPWGERLPLVAPCTGAVPVYVPLSAICGAATGSPSRRGEDGRRATTARVIGPEGHADTTADRCHPSGRPAGLGFRAGPGTGRDCPWLSGSRTRSAVAKVRNSRHRWRRGCACSFVPDRTRGAGTGQGVWGSEPEVRPCCKRRRRCCTACRSRYSI